MKKAGFTLIELLVVIVIIGILATISVATFGGYFKKARDAERQSNVNQIAAVLFTISAEDDSFSKYMAISPSDINKFLANKTPGNSVVKNLQASAIDMKNLLGKGGITGQVPKNGIGYIIQARGKSSGGGEDNQFVVATWGESTSTANPGTPGLIIKGTIVSVKNMIYAESEGDLVEANLSVDSGGGLGFERAFSGTADLSDANYENLLLAPYLLTEENIYHFAEDTGTITGGRYGGGGAACGAHAHGSVWPVLCNTCSCNDGEVQCTDQVCFM